MLNALKTILKWFVFKSNHCNRLQLALLDEKPDEKMLEILACLTVAVVHFTDQNQIPKTVYCNR